MKRLLLALSVVTGTMAGCVQPQQARFQSAEESEREKDLDVRTIGEVTEVANVGNQQVSGVGLVVGLAGTGSTPPGTYRGMLEQHLRKRKVENVKTLLESPDNAMVLVTAFIPGGARRGDPLDVEVTLPPGSKATSLRGGYLIDCSLKTFDSTKNINPDYQGANKMLEGHALARAKGPLLVGLGNPDAAEELRRGRIWEGAVSLADRPFFLILKNDEKSARIAGAVADKINFMFQDDGRRQRWLRENQRYVLLGDMMEQINTRQDVAASGRSEAAKALSKEVVHVHSPFAYRYNPERYLRVLRNVPLRETVEQQGRYRQRLRKMLLDPADTIRAAVRLEALGKESVPALKEGLAHAHPLVRFASAEALAYLGSTAGAEELTRLAEQHDLLRLASLMALASLDESVCRDHLSRLLAADDVELRCGAFRALCLNDERDPRLAGRKMNGGWWLHRVAGNSKGLAHFAMSKRAEVVLFGADVTLVPAVKIRAGKEFVVTAEVGDDRVTVSRIPDVGRDERKQCSLHLADVLLTMDGMGAGFAEVVDLLRKIEEHRCVNAPVRTNTMPPEVAIERLVEGGRDPNFLQEASLVPRGGE